MPGIHAGLSPRRRLAPTNARAGSRSFHRSLAKMSSWTLTVRNVAIPQNGGRIQSARKTTASASSRRGPARDNASALGAEPPDDVRHTLASGPGDKREKLRDLAPGGRGVTAAAERGRDGGKVDRAIGGASIADRAAF